MKASWDNTLLAESNKTIVIEGNHYFHQISVLAVGAKEPYQ
jgi:hypothetical protein